MTATWVLFVVVVGLYLARSFHCLSSGHRAAAATTMILLLGSIGVTFIREAIVGGSVMGGARLAITAAAAVLIATLGDPARMFELSDDDADARTAAGRTTRKYQLAFIALACGWTVAAMTVWPGLYD